MMGEMSMPKLVGILLLIGRKIGSVVLYKNLTIGLNGSGATQLTNALMSISQYRKVKTPFKSSANADTKLDNINISLTFTICLFLFVIYSPDGVWDYNAFLFISFVQPFYKFMLYEVIIHKLFCP